MSGCQWWEQVSAAVDGELAGPEREAAEAHAAGCMQCAASLDTVTFTLLTPNEANATSAPHPAGVDPERLTADEQRWLTGRWARRLLLVAAIIIVVEAVPAYVRGEGLSAESHAARHLATWQIGFGVGLLVAAWVSRLSHAMLALASTFAALTVVATIVDIVSGHSGPLAESVHLVELVGIFLLWRLTPPHLLPWRRSSTASDTKTSSLGLRLVNSDSSEPDESVS